MRLTTDTPKNNLEMALNLFYVKDKEVWVRGYGKNGADIRLFDLSRDLTRWNCPYVDLDISDDSFSMMMAEWLWEDVESFEHVLALLYQAAWVCAELREHLKQFEDSGCEPEEVMPKDKADEIALKLMRLADLVSLCSYDHLRELAEADKDRRVVVLPCRQGDELWTYGNFPHGREVYRFTVSDVSTLNGRTVLNTLGLGTIRPEDIGKTVFLTREEAEKAMEVSE